MSAGTFQAACMVKTHEELADALQNHLEGVAKHHGISPEWARFYLTDEINRAGRRIGGRHGKRH